MAKLTTHVLDTANGIPAAGVAIALYAVDADHRTLLMRTRTNPDGRCGAPLLQDAQLQTGHYELVFEAGAYFALQDMTLPSPMFLDRITIAFGIADSTQDYHVPLVMSPWAYSTYRGS